MRHFPLLLLCLLGCASIAAGPASSPELTSAPYTPDSGSISLRCGVLIDGLSDVQQRDALISVESGRIGGVGRAGTQSLPEDYLDLSGYTCLPGLIDMHSHIADRPNDTKDLSVYFHRTPEEQIRISMENADATLQAGFTTIRSVGDYIAWASRDIRDLINAGRAPGPRIQTAGLYLTIRGGGGDLLIPGIPEDQIPDRVRIGVARGPEQFAEKARIAVAGDADFLKIIASGAVLAYGGVPGAREMMPDEIQAVVEVAHAAGVKVTAHAHGAQSIKDAILAGADSIEHASLADDEAIRLAAERGVAFSMDVYNGDYIDTVGRAEGWPEEFLRKNVETTELQRQVFSKALRAGVVLVYGTDAAVYPHGDNAHQFRIMVERGMTPMAAIKSATSVAARVMGWDDRVGAIAPGRYGDVIAVRGDPLSDITVLEKVDYVIKGGMVFRRP